MQPLQVHSNKTELKDRTLFYDGDSVVAPSDIINNISAGRSVEGLFATELTDEIKKFNSFVPTNEQIKIKEGVGDCTLNWMLPDTFSTLNPWEYTMEKFLSTPNMDCPDERAERLVQEFKLYKKLNLLPILRVLIYIINTLEENNLVWGVGRGSSVSSYVLYVLGVHDVDSFAYDLDITDFLRI